MTPDRKQLELAAKAAGVKWDSFQEVWYKEDREYPSWNPLTDDGDRYRLARACRMRIDFYNGTIAWADLWGRFTRDPSLDFPRGNAKEEAYAIVRAAAEIEKGMK